MITHYFKTVQDAELRVLDTIRNGVWTHVVAPSDDELAALGRDFALDEAILEDSKDFFEVPRMERSGGVSYFFTRYPYDEKDEDIDTAPLLIVIGESFVITIAKRPVPQFAPFVNGKVSVVTTQKTKLFINLIGAVTAAFELELVRLRRIVHRNRLKLGRIGPKEIQRLVNYENGLNNMIAALVPTNTWLNQVTNGNFIQLYNEDVELMEDVVIANNQLIESSRSVMKTIQNVRSASEAIMTSRLNATIQTLTIITIILTIPTVVSSLYGMNVPLPFSGDPLAFWLILVAIMALVSGVVYAFKRSEWL